MVFCVLLYRTHPKYEPEWFLGNFFGLGFQCVGKSGFIAYAELFKILF